MTNDEIFFDDTLFRAIRSEEHKKVMKDMFELCMIDRSGTVEQTVFQKAIEDICFNNTLVRKVYMFQPEVSQEILDEIRELEKEKREKIHIIDEMVFLNGTLVVNRPMSQMKESEWVGLTMNLPIRHYY